MAGDGGGGGDGGGDEVGAPAAALAALEVAVAGAGAALARRRACRGSWPGTSSSPARASRSRRRGRSRGGPRPRPGPSPRSCPGTTIARGMVTVRPSATAAAARRSSMRELVHEPMKTVSTATSRSGVPAVRPMYSRARSAALRSAGSAKSSGSGPTPEMGTTWPGLVPQETCGSIAAASRTTSLSKVASSSVASVFQSATAASQSAPVGCVRRGPRGSRRWSGRGR